ncbi:MAG: IPT/TIG domain-containing protein [Solirubrobacteraceae bacterium]|jgi:hypothetical protein
MTGRIALAAREHLPWRELALAALLSLLLGAALSQGLRSVDGASPVAPSARTAASSANGLSRLAPAARASISAKIGAEDPAYHFTAAPGGLRAANQAQDMSIGVGRSGVQIQRRGVELGLSLHAVGYGDSLQALRTVSPNAAANRVEYAHAGVSEWYINGPLEVEQGFTLAHAPAHRAPGPLTLAISLSGDSRASLAPGGQRIQFTGAGGSVLDYEGLSARDANGRTLPSWLTLDGRQLLLRVDAQDARFPLSIDPGITYPEAKLSPAPGTGGEGPEEREAVGVSVALSADGSTALVGAPGGDLLAGAVWVFTRSGTKWEEQQKLESSELESTDECAEPGGGEEGEECRFGRAVALSANGEVALIGAPLANSGQGAALVYTRDGSSFTPSTELKSPEPSPLGHFGRSVSLADNGETALVGAPGELKSQGRAWVFTGSGSHWTVSAPLAGSGEQGLGCLGTSVALSGNGEVALVGAPSDNNRAGAAWVFGWTGSEWREQGPKLTGASSKEASEARFGHSVALSEDGSTALVGASNYNGGVGAAWVFTRSGDEWSEQGPKLEGDPEGGTGNEELGYSVALSAAGNSAIIGAPNADDTRGAAWLYVRSGATWSAPVKRLDRGREPLHRARFGYSVAMSANGETELVGAPTENDKSGAAWVFGHAPMIEKITPSSGTTLGGTLVKIEGENLTDATAVRFGANAASSFAVKNEDLIEAVSPAGTGSVVISVETPVGTSTAGPKFTYMPPGGGSNKHGTREEEEQQLKQAPNTGGTALLGAEAVLALGPVSSAACGASLISRKIAVQANDHALFRLLGTGTGKCSGKLRLRVEIKLAHKRFKFKTIGVAVFSITSGKRVSVSVKLNATGRSLLKLGAGRLTGNLLLVKQSPVPIVSHTASVRLALQRPKPKHKT